jgi:Tfp pilus assembly protein PilF
MAQAWCNLGLINIEQGKWSEASQYLNAALEKFRHLKNRDGQVEAMIGLIKYELVRGNEQKAEIWQEELEEFLAHQGGSTQLEQLKVRLKKYRRSLRELS